MPFSIEANAILLQAILQATAYGVLADQSASLSQRIFSSQQIASSSKIGRFQSSPYILKVSTRLPTSLPQNRGVIHPSLTNFCVDNMWITMWKYVDKSIFLVDNCG